MKTTFTPSDTVNNTTASANVSINIWETVEAYIKNSGNENVSVISTGKNKVIATVPVEFILLELQSAQMEQKYM